MNSDPIGEMRDRITIQYATYVPDGLGSYTETWDDGFAVWAKAWTVSSTEQTSDMQARGVRIQKFKIYYRRVFSPAWRIKWGNRYFNITAVDPDKDRIFLYLTCEETL